jgi:pimeloyl-ACP methyl ester carboxylesterase
LAGADEVKEIEPDRAPARGEAAGVATRRGEVIAGGRRLEYVWHGPGPGEAPTLVFLHDGLGCVSTWRDVPAALAAATGCGALVYSRAGYGGSQAAPPAAPGAPSEWPVRFMHDEAAVVLPRVLAELGVRDGFLVGHSDGASIALLYASAAEEMGGWLRGLVLEAPHVFVEPVCVESIARLAATYGQGEGGREGGGDLARRMARHHGTNADGCFAGWSGVWLRPEFRAWNIEAALPAVRCPVLAVQGADDEYGTLAQLWAVAAGCGGPVETLAVPDCGHTPHHQQRAATLAAMTDFIRRRLRDRRSGDEHA